MGDEMEMRDAQMRVTRLDGTGSGGWFPVRSAKVRVIPPDDDEYVSVRATDLVGMELIRDDFGGRATARLDGGFVVIDYPDLGAFHRTHVRADAYVRIRRRPPA